MSPPFPPACALALLLWRTYPVWGTAIGPIQAWVLTVTWVPLTVSKVTVTTLLAVA